jgi:hypothetical protein
LTVLRAFPYFAPVERFAIDTGDAATVRKAMKLGPAVSAPMVVWAPLALVVAGHAAGGCDPYPDLGGAGESLGPIDPVTFPAANLGTGGRRERPGLGVFTETHAFAGGADVGYFPYPVPAGADPLVLRLDDQPAIDVPQAFVFDPGDDDPIPAAYACKAPSGYRYSRRRDEVRLDQQGNVFTALPVATYTPGVAATTSYVPVVEQVAVSGKGHACQSMKADTQIAATFPDAKPDGEARRYLAWMIIDPSARVRPFNAPATHNGLGLQSWGWYGGYLLAYLDGGYIPTVTADGPAGPALRMVAQKLYYPRGMVTVTDAKGVAKTGAGQRGAGYDVLEAVRGQDGYSPNCAVMTYDVGAATAAEALPRDAAAITATYAATVQPAMVPYVYCLQTKERP